METILSITQVVATLIAAIGLVLSAVEIRRTRREKRLEQVQRLAERLQTAPLRDIYHEVERDQFQYPFNEPDKEKEIDGLLSEFDLMANIYKNGLIELRELELFAYPLLVVYQNPKIREYLRSVEFTFDENLRENPGGKLLRPAAYRDVCVILEKKYGHVQAWRKAGKVPSRYSE